MQIQTDPRYSDFVERSSTRTVLGVVMPVATTQDIMRGKIWAVQDPTRRPSKRQKDLADISRLIEAFPELTDLVPQEILDRLFKPNIK